MREPKTPEDENRRIQTLQSLCILDTPAEERFDRITRLARRLFGVPIALVSLVDTNRQWFKSRQGLDATETSREISFCGHAVLSDEILIIPDASRDDRFSDNPLVTDEPHIRFYAGCPVSAPNRQRLGTLCIIDREPRELLPGDIEALRDLGGMVEAELAAFSLATTDALTGISNRRGFEILGDLALRSAVRDQRPVALLFLDLDGFKRVNDTLGHEAGDQMLIEMASLFLRALRDSDVVARVGGDEFCALLSGIEESDVHRPLDRLARLVAERNAAPEAAAPLEYSVGYVTNPMVSPVGMPELMVQADRGMYEQKNKRKHRVVVTSRRPEARR